MRDHLSSPPSVVVGIDGSRSGVEAALWAVEEAVSRDIPLRLVYAIDPAKAGDRPAGHGPRTRRRLKSPSGTPYTAVESTNKPVKIEVEILQARPTRALIEASRWAAMLCVGAIGLKHSTQGRIGSTAAALASSAHCPVAVVAQARSAPRRTRGWSPRSTSARRGNGVLRCAAGRGAVRDAPLRVLTTWQSRFTDIHDAHAVADGNRMAKAQLDRRLAQWKKRYPDLDVRAVAVHGSTLNFLTKNASSIQLLVVGHERRQGVSARYGPAGLCRTAQLRLFRVGLRTAERIVSATSNVSAASTEGLRVVKVFLVDDHEVVRRGLIDLLSADPELDVIGEAGSVAQAMARIPALAARRCRARRAAARRQRHRTVPRPAVSAARSALPDADVVHLRRGDARRDPRRRQRIRRQGHQGHGARPGHQGGRRGPLPARQPGRGGADGQAARRRRAHPIRCPGSPTRNACCWICSARD